MKLGFLYIAEDASFDSWEEANKHRENSKEKYHKLSETKDERYYLTITVINGIYLEKEEFIIIDNMKKWVLKHFVSVLD